MTDSPPLHHEVVAGDVGRVTLLVHGFLGSGRNLRSLARRLHELEPGSKVVTVDLPGHGESPPLPDGAHLGDLAAALAVLLEDLGGGPARVVGHSLGGRVALALLRDHSARVASVDLLDISASPVPRGGDVEGVLEILLAAPSEVEERSEVRDHLTGGGLPRHLADWLLMNLRPREGGGYAWRFDRAALAEAHPRWAPEDLWDVVERPDTPVERVVRGGESRFVPDEDAARFERAGVRVYTLEGVGHFVHAESQEAVLRALTDRPR